MRTDNGDIPQNQQVLIDDLRILLEKQIESANQGNIRDVESLSEQINPLVEKIAQGGFLELAEFKNRRQQLQKLYKNLRLALAAQKAEAGENLSRVRRCKKTIQTYRSNI
jgi:hypothetical protein